MARWRERVRPEDGLKLDLNRLIRQNLVRPGEAWGGTIRGDCIRLRVENTSAATCIRIRLKATFKRAIYGTNHHVSQKHLKRYLAEFDFRYNERAALGVEDTERTTKALSGIIGKRLMYKDSSLAAG